MLATLTIDRRPRAREAVARDLARAPEVALQVDVERLVPGAHVGVEHRPEVRVGAGVVDEHVDLAEALDRSAGRGARSRLPCPVCAATARTRSAPCSFAIDAATACTPSSLREAITTRRPVGDERARDGLADATAAARDDGDLSVERDPYGHEGELPHPGERSKSREFRARGRSIPVHAECPCRTPARRSPPQATIAPIARKRA